MPDHRHLLERRARRGSERGLDAVLDAARRSPLPPVDPPQRRTSHLVLAVALVVLIVGGAVTVGIARTRSTDGVVGATTDEPVGPTPWMLPAELPSGTVLQSVRTDTTFD